MYRWFYKHILSMIDAERAHNMALWFLERNMSRIMFRKVPTDSRLNIHVAGVKFDNPIGMAAGFDKKGTVFPSLFSLGFGHVEVGTVTLEPRVGKERPRIWRRGPELFNRMGLPGPGVDTVTTNVWARPSTGIVGASISPENTFKAKDEDVLHELFLRLYDDVDYITVNLSCPNVNEDGLYEIENILQRLQEDRLFLESLGVTHVPLFVKSGPSLTYDDSFAHHHDPDSLKRYLDMLIKHRVSGVVLVNTLPDVLEIGGKRLHGGRSGPFLKEHGLQSVRTAYKHTGGSLPIIGVGGIASAADALDYIRCGASLVQLYTGFVTQGPRLPERILEGILDELGNQSVADIVGVQS